VTVCVKKLDREHGSSNAGHLNIAIENVPQYFSICHEIDLYRNPSKPKSVGSEISEFISVDAIPGTGIALVKIQLYIQLV
jgi:hypothetical protein